MYFLKLITVLVVVSAVLGGTQEETKNRGKRQHISFKPRRSGRPPPYAVSMEPITQYSQRDPLYGPIVESKSDEYSDHYEEGPTYNYYPTEPEPIIEIIIKESNESLPAPPLQLLPVTTRPKKEPIQVFYVKYEKKKDPGDSKSRVVYDAPIPALTPVEEHHEEKPEHAESVTYRPENIPEPITPTPIEPSTTLRAIIRPDSEVYHSGSSGIRITFGSEQVPPNNHNKRSDQEAPTSTVSAKPTLLASPGASKRPHGPYAQLQPFPQHVTPAFPQQRIVNSFAHQQLLQQPPHPLQQLPPNFSSQHQFQSGPPPNRNPQLVQNQRPQRLPFTIQGLPEVQQRVPFSSFSAPHLQQQTGFSSGHQSNNNFQANNQRTQSGHKGNFFDQQTFQQQQLPLVHQEIRFKQEQEKQRYHEQQRHQEQIKQREQQRLAEQQRFISQQRQQEQRLLEQQRRKQEQDQKLRQQYQQNLRQQQFRVNQQPQSQHQTSQETSGEILKSIPKLEQHYAIRENPLQPGPFPTHSPTPVSTSQHQDVAQPSFGRVQNSNQFSPSAPQQYIQHQQYQQQKQKQPLSSNPSKQTTYQNPESFFSQNLPAPQQQRAPPSAPESSIWGRPTFQGKNLYSGQKIYATPNSNTVEPNYPSTTPRIYVTSPKPTTPAPTPATYSTERPTATTTVSPKHAARIQENIASLPDEVPDDIREQLLSSGILGNADIQILDYDKVGGINIENLPPEALANFYGAGGASATSASEPVPKIVKRPKNTESEELQTASSSNPGKVSSANSVSGKFEQTKLRSGGVEMKVIRFDPNTVQGQSIADQHIRDDATILSPVTVGERDPSQYNRYLPLRVNGASFPIPDVPELNGKMISSVVVLAPVDYSFQPEETDSRQSRKIADVQTIRFLAGDSLKQLVKKPSAENYKRWLEQERHSEPQMQSVVLLVTTTADGDSHVEKEIFMYDVSSESVSRLSGDLSSAFVDAAESNSDGSVDTIGDASSDAEQD